MASPGLLTHAIRSVAINCGWGIALGSIFFFTADGQGAAWWLKSVAVSTTYSNFIGLPRRVGVRFECRDLLRGQGHPTAPNALTVYLWPFAEVHRAPGLGHVYADRWLEGLAFAGGTVAIGMLGTVGVVASPFLARAALVGATAAWIALWCVAFVSAARGARSADPEAGVAAVAPIRRAYFKGLLVVLTLASLATWAIAVRERVMEVFRVPSPSMEPAIVPGTRVLVDKLAYRSGPVRRGDVVVFVNPNERWQSYSVAGTRGGAHTQRFVLSTRRQSSSVEGQPRSKSAVTNVSADLATNLGNKSARATEDRAR
jgi:hypothetical protein